MDNFYKDKKVLVTGHTGFKGSWLSIWLHKMGAQVIGFSQEPHTPNDNFVLSGIANNIRDLRGDICKPEEITEVFESHKPEIVFHLAAQALVRQSYANPVDTYQTNVMGTINLMEAFRNSSSAKVAVMVTSDKCYENGENMHAYKETDPLGGYDPYSSSKAAAEIAISSWRRSYMNPNNYENHLKSIASVRAGNVIGGGDWTADRIVPDCMRALEADKVIKIRNPKAIRPWQHVLDPLGGYLCLAQKMWDNPTRYCESWNFGPQQNSIANVLDIVNLIIKHYGKGETKDVSPANAPHEAQLLLLDINKAQTQLNWEPRLNLEQSIQFTVDWYKQYKTKNVYDICVEQIEKMQTFLIP